MKIIILIFNKLTKAIQVMGVKKPALTQSGKKFPPDMIVNILTGSGSGCRDCWRKGENIKRFGVF